MANRQDTNHIKAFIANLARSPGVSLVFGKMFSLFADNCEQCEPVHDGDQDLWIPIFMLEEQHLPGEYRFIHVYSQIIFYTLQVSF